MSAGRRARPYLAAIVTAAGATLLCAAAPAQVDNSSRVMVYLLGVAFVATRHGRGPSALAAVLAIGLFDFFFVPPHLTFAVTDTQYLVTFGVMLLVSLLISTLASRVREHAEAAERREAMTHALYALTRDLSDARSAGEVADASCRHAAAVLGGESSFVLAAADGQDCRVISGSPTDEEIEQARRTIAGLGAAVPDGAIAGPDGLCSIVPGTDGAVGALLVRMNGQARDVAPDRRELAQSIARQAGSALERIRHAARAENARVVAETEALRSTLLSSLSHDLRTPLAAIAGAASSLLQPVELEPSIERGLKESIFSEAERLSRLVSNLLDMTRAESGAMAVTRDWNVVEELVGSALERVGPLGEGRALLTDVTDDLPLVPVDAVLVEQVIVNLVENAARHARPATFVRVAATADAREVTLEVEDDGPGIAAGREEQVFAKFYREEGGGAGVGLGLAICRAIVTAHGGRIWVAPRSPRGARFRFTLPLGDGAPAAAQEVEDA